MPSFLSLDEEGLNYYVSIFGTFLNHVPKWVGIISYVHKILVFFEVDISSTKYLPCLVNVLSMRMPPKDIFSA